jgi:Protein of unknown function (DUF1403)
MIRPLSDALLSGPAVPRLPAWARKTPDPERPCDAAARAGAALCTLHAVIGSAPPWAGVWRDRLALAAAQKSCRRLGRSDDEASLREAFLFRSSEAAPSPAERVFLGWQQLALPEALAPPGLRRAAAALGYVGPLEAEALARAIVAATGEAAALTAAMAAIVMASGRPDAATEVYACFVADAVLAKSLRWPKPLPLFAVGFFGGMAGPGRGALRFRPGDETFAAAVAQAIAAGAAAALDAAAAIARRAEILAAVAPRVRARGKEVAIAALLSADAVTPARIRSKTLPDRAARRLLERLVALGGARELSGRKTFRIYGL